jgi:hypothetical protein
VRLLDFEIPEAGVGQMDINAKLVWSIATDLIESLFCQLMPPRYGIHSSKPKPHILIRWVQVNQQSTRRFSASILSSGEITLNKSLELGVKHRSDLLSTHVLTSLKKLGCIKSCDTPSGLANRNSSDGQRALRRGIKRMQYVGLVNIGHTLRGYALD